MVQEQRRIVPFIGMTSPAKSMVVNDQLTDNFVTVVNSMGAKQQVTLESAPGVVFFADAGNGACRTPQLYAWLHPDDGTTELYGVFGSKLVRITSGGAITEIGTLNTSSGTCRIARGRTYLMIVDGAEGYTYDGTTFAQISDADFPDSGSTPAAAPTHVVYLDSFFIVNDASSDNFHISGIEDPTAWNALDFDAAAVSPDRALALAATESTLWVLGDETCEAYYNSGNSLFPFEINLSATQQVGIAAPQTVSQMQGAIRFLATSPQGGLFVWEVNGFQGRKISTDEIEQELLTRDIADAYAFSYTQGGRSFYCLQLEPDKPTLVYNASSGIWESRSILGGEAYRIAGVGTLNQLVIGGSRLAARLFTLDPTRHQDDGRELVRTRRTAIQHQNDHLIDWWEIVIDAEYATTDSPTDEPVVRLRYSDDGGFEWSSYLTQSMGKQGQRGIRAVFYALGSSRARIYEVSFDGDHRVVLIAAYARISLNWD